MEYAWKFSLTNFMIVWKPRKYSFAIGTLYKLYNGVRTLCKLKRIKITSFVCLNSNRYCFDVMPRLALATFASDYLPTVPFCRAFIKEGFNILNAYQNQRGSLIIAGYSKACPELHWMKYVILFFRSWE